MDYRIALYVFFGVLPSFVWLLYYLSKDKHPEPKRAILSVFLWGAVSTVPVFFIQLGLSQLLNGFALPQLYRDLIYWFVIISFVEELFKFFIVKFKVLDSQHLDEPLDLMLYMVVAALGFAALENILYLFNQPGSLVSFERLLETTMILSAVRFLGATFLHTLCSAIIGYFLAYELRAPHRRFYLTELGVLLAVALHGAYDLLIINLVDYQTLLALSIIMLTFAFLTFVGFERLKKLKSVSMVEIET